MTREALHRLVDELPDERLDEAELALRDVCQAPRLYTFADAPYDDEPVTDEERRELDLARAEMDRGDVIPHAEVMRLIGTQSQARLLLLEPLAIALPCASMREPAH